jgi:DedD protein
MEKEQKKFLLVAVSVGVFLLVTITAAIVIMTPKQGADEIAFTSPQPYPSGRIQVATESPGIVPIQPSQPVQPVQEETNGRISIEETTAIDIMNGDQLTINIPRPTTAAVPDTPAAVSSSRPVATVAPARPAAAVTGQSAAQARPAASAATAARPVSSAAARTAPAQTPARTTNDFWVQTGAFSAQVRAEDAKELLASKGITSIIENRQIDGKIWYRVRLGPYTSEKEANYWLALVKSIDGFGESQVRQTVRQQ